MKIEIGQHAPDFTLYDTTKNKISLSALKGHNVLLLFFPQAFTSICTKELCSVRDNISLYNNANATVWEFLLIRFTLLQNSKKNNNIISHC